MAKRKKVITLANQITILRIILVPAIVITLLQGQKMAVIVLLSLSILTDFFDGMAARLRREQTKLGAFLDPMADKLLLTSVYMALTFLGIIETWIFVIIFSRDLLIVLGWTVIYILTGASNTTPRILGKLTTGAQMVTALACIIPISGVFHEIMIWTVIVLTISSAIDYIIYGEKQLGGWG